MPNIQLSRDTPRMRQIAFSLPEDVIDLVERQARIRFRDRAEHLRELVIGALLGNGSLKPRSNLSEGSK